MGARVVCISHTSGAGGEAVARAVAQHLRFRFVDDEIIAKAARKAGVDPELVAQAEHKQPLLTRFLDVLRTAAPVATALNFATPEPMEISYYHLVPLETKPAGGTEEYRALIRDVVREVAAEGDVVVTAHAASIALGARPETLRVLVTASPATRIERLSAAGQLLNEGDAATAVAESDRARQYYLATFYGVKEELPTHYDLVVNTDVLPADQVVRMIVGAAQA
jgi:cytidylate kinase